MMLGGKNPFAEAVTLVFYNKTIQAKRRMVISQINNLKAVETFDNSWILSLGSLMIRR